MKKFAILLAMVSIVSFASAQPIVVSAFNYLNNGQLDKAKKSIDEAINNETAKIKAKTWVYRGNVYLEIYLANNVIKKGVPVGASKEDAIKKLGKPKTTTAKDGGEQLAYEDDYDYTLFLNFQDNLLKSYYKEGKFKNIDSNSLQIAYDAYQKAIELDTKKEYWESQDPKLNVQFKLYIIGEQYYNKGVEYYQTKKYSDAIVFFERTAKINAIFGAKDTTATYNVAICAEKSGDLKKAKEAYNSLIKAGIQNADVYSSLANIYRTEKDTVKALNTVKKGREMFPDNYNMIIAETNLYLAMGKTKEAQENLKLAIAKDPKNENLYFAVGANFDQIANDPKSKPEEIAAAMLEAEANYMKAIEIKPDYFDAIYNLGAMYFNDGVRIFESAAKIDINDAKGYKDAQDRYDARWKQALPHLEKALTLMPDDQSTLMSLKQLYTRTNQPEKLKAVNDKLGTKK
ncbi:MAG: hypothetical protein HXX09_12810 [Bacteroidetes bacterium]|nr:hypothetical protein [Bacteroidota bacterium]